MASDNYVIDSFENFIKNINGLNCLIYKDGSKDVSEVLTVTSTTSTDGETPFIVEDIDGIITSEDENYLVNRYVNFISPTDYSSKMIRIISYNNTTGQITLEEGFGETISDSVSFNIEIIKSIFIRPINKITLGGQSRFSKRFIRFNMHIKTKYDGDKYMQNEIQDLITSEIGKYRSADIKNDSDVVIGRMRFQNEPNYTETTDEDTQFVEYLASLPTEYYVDNFG